MSESAPAPQTGNPPPKRRNPVELFLVRGFIVVMLILIAIEGNSWWQHRKAIAALGEKMKAVDEVPNSAAVTEADVKQLLGGKACDRSVTPEAGNNFTGASRIDVYSWFTISPLNKREIYVYYGKATKEDVNGPEVLAVQAKDEAPPAPPQMAGDQQPPPEMGPGAAGMMPGMPGPGGGRRGRPGGDSSAAAPADGQDGEKTESDKPAEDNSDDDKPKDKDGQTEKDEQ
jgi:hypothetical protein